MEIPLSIMEKNELKLLWDETNVIISMYAFPKCGCTLLQALGKLR